MDVWERDALIRFEQHFSITAHEDCSKLTVEVMASPKASPQGLKQELYTFFFQSREFPLSFYSYSILLPLLLYHSIIWMYFGGQYLSHSKVWKAEPYIVYVYNKYVYYTL